LESDLQQGAYTGFQLTWVLFWATVMGLLLQELSARIGVVTGKDLAQNVRVHYPRWLNYVIYVNMELAVIASDIQEVVGSGVALYLLTNGSLPVWLGCLITGADTFTFIAVHYMGVRYLEALVCILIATMTGCFFYNWGSSEVNTGQLLQGLVLPTLPSRATQSMLAVGTIGAVIMPHNLYLHSGLVLSRKIDRQSSAKVTEAIIYNFIESALALSASFIINLAILATNAANFYNPVCAHDDAGPFACLDLAAFDAGSGDPGSPCSLPFGKGVGACGEIGIKGEGSALEHGLGKYALYIWAVGLLAAGQASTMTCTYAGQIIMGGCLQFELAAWKRVAVTRAFALGPAVLVAVCTYGNDALFNTINELLNMLQSLQLPFSMLPLLTIASSSHVMHSFALGRVGKAILYCIAALVLTVNVILVVQWAIELPTSGTVCISLYGVMYLAICFCMMAMLKKETSSLIRESPRT